MAEQKTASLSAGSASAVLWKKAKDSEPSMIHVLVLKTEKAMAAFCCVGIGAMDDSLADRVLEKLTGQGSQVTSDGLWLIPSGRESKGMVEGPAKEAFWGRFNEQSAEEAAEKITAAILKAEQTMAAAQLRIAEVEAPEWQKPRSDGSGTADSTLTAMEVENLEGSSIAFLVNYAMNLHASSDLRGFASEGDSVSREASSESEVPVLFVNGAAGDIESVNASNDKEGPSSLGIKMAQAILPVLDQEPARSEIALAIAGRSVILPPSALGSGISSRTRLRAVRIDDALCLSLPGIPSAQIGLLLRAQALTQGADHVFLMARTGDALGYQPGVEEYFAVTDAVQDCHFGPLMILWYGQHSFARPADEENQEPIWSSIPILDRFSRAFAMAMDRGRQESEILQKTWEQDRVRLEKNKTALLAAVDKHLDRLLKLAANEDPDTSFGALLEALAAQCRRDMGIFSEEERVMLMGLAYGAGMPFDAIFLLQAFSRPNEWPQALSVPLVKSGVKGRDVLSAQGKML